MRIEVLPTPHQAAQPAGPASREPTDGRSATVRALNSEGTTTATCALWSHSLPTLNGKRLGYIGAFESHDPLAATQMLEAAGAWLTRQGCQLAVGPIDASTWHRYRFVTESSSEPPFTFETLNPPEWPHIWSQAGFAPLATYHSAVNDRIEVSDPILAASSSKARAAGLVLRPLSLDRFEDELRAIFNLSLAAFADNFLYSAIGWDEFSGMYSTMRAVLDPRLALVCDAPDHPGTLAGYVMAFPDMLERQRVGSSTTLVIKTLAVHSRWRSVGLGTWLVAQTQANAKSMGMSRTIFALMHDSNHSANISRHYSRVFRRYTLFARELHP